MAQGKTEAERLPVTSERIVDTAAELLVSHGPEKITLTLIAQELGVTQPALYKHVSGLDAVWRALGLREREELAARLVTATAGVAGDDAVRAVATAWRAFASDLPSLYRIGSRYPVAGDAQLEAAVDKVISVFVAALRGFDLSDGQRMHAAVALRSALHGFCAFELGDGNPRSLNSDESYNHTVEVFLVGLHALASGTIEPLQE